VSDDGLLLEIQRRHNKRFSRSRSAALRGAAETRRQHAPKVNHRKCHCAMMEKPTFNYDEMSDTLYVVFEPGEKAAGIELNDHILLCINKRERKAIGLTFFN